MEPALTDRRTVQRLLRRYGVRPRKHWGQSFLVSRQILERIVRAADVAAGETILEIGGGLGVLTAALAERGARVIVYERDPKLCAALTDLLAQFPNITIVCDDARRITADTRQPRTNTPILPTRYKLVANLPYGVATVVLRKLLEAEHPPISCVVMLQRDVAERIAASPPHLTMLAAIIQNLAEPKILFSVPRSATWPPPKVEGAVVALRPRSRRPTATAHERFVATVRRGFAHPRKHVLRNLADDATLRSIIAERCAVPPKARPQELSVPQWECIAGIIGRESADDIVAP